ncbi:MAG: hypothetical protein K6D96_04115 [Acetatifactor sp.]|nr:hypothetical protein [Acetatifactor sp.]
MKSYNDPDPGLNKTVSNIVIGMENDGAIRHLAMEGLSVPEIKNRLLFPVSLKVIGETVYKCFTDEGIFLSNEPGSGEVKEAYRFVEEYDSYGKPYFRRVKDKCVRDEKIIWTEKNISLTDGEEILKTLTGKYAYTEFGKIKYQGGELLKNIQNTLNEDEFRTIVEIPFPLSGIYIKLFGVYESIISGLISDKLYKGVIYDPENKTKYVIS